LGYAHIREIVYAATSMSNIRNPVRTFVFCCLATISASQLCSGQQYFPGNIFELRPPHVRISEASESAANPRGHKSFDFFEAPPEIPPQSDVRLSEQDSLSLVYPAHGGSFHSGGSSLFDRLRIDALQLELDLFHFLNPFGPVGHTLVPPRENSLFIGRLSPGGYQVNIRNWYLPPILGFDPETFVPPANAITPTDPIFATPISSDDPPILIETSFHFRVLAIPEASTLSLIVIAFFVLMGWARSRTR
jgi:hypothetical protein